MCCDFFYPLPHAFFCVLILRWWCFWFVYYSIREFVLSSDAGSQLLLIHKRSGQVNGIFHVCYIFANARKNLLRACAKCGVSISALFLPLLKDALWSHNNWKYTYANQKLVLVNYRFQMLYVIRIFSAPMYVQQYLLGMAQLWWCRKIILNVSKNQLVWDRDILMKPTLINLATQTYYYWEEVLICSFWRRADLKVN